MQRHPEDDQHDQDRADAVDDGAFLNGRIFLVGDRDRSGQPDARAIVAGEFQVGCGLPDRIGGVLAGLQRLIVDDRLELDEGALVGIGQRLVADQFAPGEIRVALVEHGLDGLRDQIEWPGGVVEFDLAALDAGKSRLERPGEAADRGIAGHDLDQGSGGLQLAGRLCHLLRRQEQQAVPRKELAGTERLHRFEILGVTLELFRQRIGGAAGEFRRRRLHHRQDQFFAIEGLLELDVALAPVEIGRDQLVDVGIDGEMARGIDARRDRQASERIRTKGAKRVQALTIETTTLVSTSFLSNFENYVEEPAENARYLAEFHPPI